MVAVAHSAEPQVEQELPQEQAHLAALQAEQELLAELSQGQPRQDH
jgi:hypothetical protein